MFDNPQSPVGLALSHLAAAREQLRDVDLATLSGDELLELMAALEIDVRQRAAVGYGLVAELEARGVAAELGCSSTAVLLSERLRIGRREAAAAGAAGGAARAPTGPVRGIVAGPVPAGRRGSGGREPSATGTPP